MDFIGFIISLLALLYLFYKQQSIVRYREENPEFFEEDELSEDEPIKEIIRAMEKKTVKKEQLPPPKPAIKASAIKPPKKTPLKSPLEEYHLASPIEKREIKSALESRRLKSKLASRTIEDKTLTVVSHPLDHLVERIGGTRPSRGKIAIKRLSRLSDLVIYKEIIDKPKSMRPLT